MVAQLTRGPQATMILVLALGSAVAGSGAAAWAADAPNAAPAKETTTPAAAATERLILKVPAGGSYLAWVEGRGGARPPATAPVQFTGAETSIALPKATEELRTWAVLVLDQKSGYSAMKEVPVKAEGERSLTLAAPEFNRVHRVRVQITGAGGKPIASGTVMLAGAGATAETHVLDPSASGTVEFTDVPVGTARLAVTPGGGGSTTKEVEISLPRGETVQTLSLPLPEVTAVVEGAAPAATPAPNGPASTSTPVNAPTPSTMPANAPASAPQPLPPAPAGGSSPLTSLVGFLLLAGIAYAAFTVARQRGWTLDKGLARLGIPPGPEPGTVAAGPASLRPAPAPPPPVDPNVCPFCGERKDPVSGRCACSVDAAPAGAGSLGASPFAAPPGGGSGPRLVAMQGTYMGQIFALGGELTIGRDPSNGIPLPTDTTVSRRHARLAPADGGYRVEDMGSSNGTFVNGARVTEATLRPGDEVSIGGTRFRFEA
jgi:hypothetical protein